MKPAPINPSPIPRRGGKPPDEGRSTGATLVGVGVSADVAVGERGAAVGEGVGGDVGVGVEVAIGPGGTGVRTSGVAVGGTGVAVGAMGVSPEGGGGGGSVTGGGTGVSPEGGGAGGSVAGGGTGVRVGTVWRLGDCPGAAQRSGPTVSPTISSPINTSQGIALLIAPS